MSVYQTQLRPPSRLTSALAGKVVIPEHARFDEARRAWNLAIDQRPSAVVYPESPQDVAAAVLFAREFGQQIAAQGTGHNAGPLGSLENTTLLKTERMRGVSIDPARRTARVEAGVVWLEVVEAAAQHGLAGLRPSPTRCTCCRRRWPRGWAQAGLRMCAGLGGARRLRSRIARGGWPSRS